MSDNTFEPGQPLSAPTQVRDDDQPEPIPNASRRGPAWGTMILGAVLLAFAGQAILRNLVRFEWPVSGPITAVVAGLLLMIVGLIASRRRR